MTKLRYAFTSDGCVASGVTRMSMYGKSGKADRIWCSSSLESTSIIEKLAYSPAMRQMCGHLPFRCRSCEYAFSRPISSDRVCGSRSAGRCTSMRTWNSTSAPFGIEREVVGDRLGAVSFGLRFENQFRLHCTGDVIRVVQIAREVQLCGELFVARSRHFHVQVGGTPRVPACRRDQLSARSVGRNLVRRRTNRGDFEGTVFFGGEAAP